MGRNISQQGTLFVYMLGFGFSVCVFISMFSFFFSFFLFFIHAFQGDKIYCLQLQQYCLRTVHGTHSHFIQNKNIKNRSHGTINTFKNYFAIVFSIFSFQFSVSTKISSIQTAPIYNQCPTHRLMLGSKDVGFMYLES